VSDYVKINRAPVLTLWAAVVAERLGFDRDEALTLGKAVAGLNAYSKGVNLGLYEPTPETERERKRKAKDGATLHVDLLHRAVAVIQTPKGLRALNKDKSVTPESVERYLQNKFGERLDEVRKAMEHLARAQPPAKLAHDAYALYERFRPAIPEGVRGWGAAGELDLRKVVALSREYAANQARERA
jgi:hypothetical protein